MPSWAGFPPRCTGRPGGGEARRKRASKPRSPSPREGWLRRRLTGAGDFRVAVLRLLGALRVFLRLEEEDRLLAAVLPRDEPLAAGLPRAVR